MRPRPIRGVGWALLPAPIAWGRQGCPPASICTWTTSRCCSTAPRAITVSGDITIDLDGYVLLAGGFAVNKSTPSVDLLGDGVVDVDLLRIDLVGVDLFLGVGGVLD